MVTSLKCSFSNAEHGYLVTILVFSIFAIKYIKWAHIGSKMVLSQVPVYGMLPKLLKVVYLGILKTMDMLQNTQFYFENGNFLNSLHPAQPHPCQKKLKFTDYTRFSNRIPIARSNSNCGVLARGTAFVI